MRRRGGEEGGRYTYDYLDIVLMANDTRLRTVRNCTVTRIRRADDIHPRISSSTILHPTPRERPRRALPQIIRSERLQLRARVGGGRVRAVREHVLYGVEDGFGAVVAEGCVDDGSEGFFWE